MSDMLEGVLETSVPAMAAKGPKAGDVFAQLKITSIACEQAPRHELALGTTKILR